MYNYFKTSALPLGVTISDNTHLLLADRQTWHGYTADDISYPEYEPRVTDFVLFFLYQECQEQYKWEQCYCSGFC